MRNTWWLLPSVFTRQNESHVTCMCHMVIFQCKKVASEDMLFWQCAVMEYFVKEESLLQISTHDFSMHMEVPAWAINPNWLPANSLYMDKHRKNQVACQRESMCDREMVLETGIGHCAVPIKSVHAEFLTCCWKNTNISEKMFPHNSWNSILSRAMNLFMAWWWVMEVYFFTLIWKQNDSMEWYHTLPYKRICSDALSPSDHGNCLLGCWRMHIGQVLPQQETSMLLLAFRHSRSFIMLFVTDVQGRERSFCNMTALCPTLLFFEWRGFRRMRRIAGKFSLLSTPQAGPSPLRLPSFWVDKGLYMRSALYDQWGRPWSSLSFKISWNRVPPQDHHISRTVVKIMNQSGWGFHGEVNTVWILNWHVRWGKVSPCSRPHGPRRGVEV